MRVIDCAAMLEPHWHWNTTTFVSQSRSEGDEFQEFGLKWRGSGFSQVSSPGWKIQGARALEAYSLDVFAGVAAVVDFDPETEIDFEARLRAVSPRSILVLRTGHASRYSRRHVEYWRRAPQIPAEVAEIAARLGFVHIATDLPCDSVAARRPDGSGAIANGNDGFRTRAHELGMLVTENCENLESIPDGETFFASLPLAVPGATTSPCSPIALTDWPSDRPVLRDVSTPMFNHWRWKLDVYTGRSFDAGDGADEIHYDFGGHGFTHCDAPCHMERDGASIHELENRGLDRFVGDAQLVDFSDLDLPHPITLDLMRTRAEHVRPGTRVILRSDLTDRIGYESRVWHLKAPNLEEDAARWLAERGPAAVCLDFPQDFIAREMPNRHVRNEEFVAHHAIFGRGIPFVEDLLHLGSISADNPFLLAVPLKMDCRDGAPMRVLAVEW